MSLLAGVNGFVTLFVALELFSLSLYILCALDSLRWRRSRAGLKYLVIGSVGSAFLLFGSALIYGGDEARCASTRSSRRSSRAAPSTRS